MVVWLRSAFLETKEEKRTEGLHDHREGDLGLDFGGLGLVGHLSSPVLMM